MAFIAAIRARYPLIGRFLAETGGATAIEYAVIASMISIAILGTVNALGGNLQNTFYNKLTALFP
jgi:pilus assembly protein Flp/PilA